VTLIECAHVANRATGWYACRCQPQGTRRGLHVAVRQDGGCDPEVPLRVLRPPDHGRAARSYQICPVCFWEDYALQLLWPGWAAGANRTSLIEAQQYFEEFGACARGPWSMCPPEDDEPLNPSWRPIDPERNSFDPWAIQLAAWPDDRNVL
jgi:hypothetical protein